MEPLRISADPSPETIQIVSGETGLGYMLINVADFDPATMTRYVEGATRPSRARRRTPSGQSAST